MNARMPEWLDADAPLEEFEHAAQLAFLSARGPQRALDLGCGSGRILLPLLHAGWTIAGVDRDGEALKRCRTACGNSESASLYEFDFLSADENAWQAGPESLAPFDVVLCLGNTFMLVTEPGDAMRLVGRLAAMLRPGGVLYLDDFPQVLRRELTEGNWLEGVSEDGRMQMIWAPGDACFALRLDEGVDVGCWRIREGEPVYRLWDYGALDILMEACGFQPCSRDDAAETMLIGWQRDV